MPSKLAIIYTVLPIMVACSYIFMRVSSAGGLDSIISRLFPSTTFATPTSQFSLYLTLTFYLAILLLFLSSAIMVLRVTLGKSPLVGIQPGNIGTLNRILQNTIQQFIIFSGIFLYLMHNNGFGLNGKQIRILAFWFLAGRVIYTIGYYMGHLTGIDSFRSMGFATNLNTNFIMLSQIFGYPLMNMMF